MASRTEMIGVQHYDSDGGLDWFVKGSQWTDWYRHELKRKSKEDIRREVLEAFTRALDFALELGKD